MANFTSKFTALIEADGTGAVRELGKISKAADKANVQAGKSTDGLKAKISGFASSISGPALIGGFAAAGAAVGAFALKAVSSFESLGVQVGKFHDATGISNVESSKFINLADDLGVGADTLQGAIGKMNKAAGATPGVFQEAGINIAYAADGTVDANQTFLNTVDVLSAMKDPAERATLATKLFGRGYQQAASIIFGGSEQIKKSFDSINQAQIFDDAKVAKAREVQVSFADLGDAVQALELELGEKLAPALIRVANAIAKVVGYSDVLLDFNTTTKESAKNTDGWLGKIARGSQTLAKGISDVFVYSGKQKENAKSTKDAAVATDDLVKAQSAQSQQSSALVQGLQAQADAAQAIADAEPAKTAQALADADKNAADAANKLADSQKAAADAIIERIDAQRAATDSVYALQKADSDFGKSVGEVATAQTDLGAAFKKTDYKDAKEKTNAVADAYGKLIDSQDNARQSAVDLSLAAVKLATDQEKSRGSTLGVVASLDIQNASLLRSAATTKGPVRDAIVGYIAKLNDIDPVKVTDIIAHADPAHLSDAERKINVASRTRSMAINAQAYTADAERALQRLVNIARAARFEIAKATGKPTDFTVGQQASGGVASGLTLVGERGPELMDVGQPSRVYNATDTVRMLSGGNSSGPNVTININAGLGSDGQQIGRVIVEHLRNYQRTSGPLPLKVA